MCSSGLITFWIVWQPAYRARCCRAQDLDHADIDVLLQQVGGEAVAERVWRHVLLDPSRLGSGMAGTIELTWGHRLRGIAARKEPALWSRRLPPSAQQFEQARREHHVAVLVKR